MASGAGEGHVRLNLRGLVLGASGRKAEHREQGQRGVAVAECLGEPRWAEWQASQDPMNDPVALLPSEADVRVSSASDRYA